MYQIADFQNQMILVAKKNRRYPTLVSEMQAIATGLGSDTSTHDLTIRLPPAAVRPDKKNHTPFTNEALLLVNRGKGGNLTAAAMATAINNALAPLLPPSNTVAPVISGTGTVGQVLTNGSPGSWQPPGATYTRQWLRNNANIALNGTATSYTLVAADSGTNVSCRVTATNANGSSSAVSNAIAVA